MHCSLFIAAAILSLVISAPSEVLVMEEVTVVEVSTESPKLCSTVACGLCVILLDILQPLALSPELDEWSNQFVKHICEWNGKSKQERFMCWVVMYDTVKMMLKLFHDMNPREACRNTTLCSTQPDYAVSSPTGSSMQETNGFVSQHLNCFALKNLFGEASDTTVASANMSDQIGKLQEELSKLVADTV